MGSWVLLLKFENFGEIGSDWSSAKVLDSWTGKFLNFAGKKGLVFGFWS